MTKKSKVFNQEKTIPQEKKRSRSRRIFMTILFSLILFFILVFINGMIIHHNTGIDEVENIVFPEAENDFWR